MTTQTLDHHSLDRPALTLDQARRLVAGETSLRSRVVHTLLLLASLGMTSVVAALLLTEPNLPTRTRIAFTALLAVGLAWSGLFGWILARRRVLYARHRVIAGRLAVGATTLFVVGSLMLAALAPEQTRLGLAAAALGSVLLGVAIFVLVRAHRRRRQLLELKERLETR